MKGFGVGIIHFIVFSLFQFSLKIKNYVIHDAKSRKFWKKANEISWHKNKDLYCNNIVKYLKANKNIEIDPVQTALSTIFHQ